MADQIENIDLGPLFEPDPVLFRFETVGWYVLFTLLLILALFLLTKAVRGYLKNAYRRKAIELLGSIENAFRRDQDPACISDVMILLKQVSLTSYGRAQVAELSGLVWLEFLESKTSNTPFSEFNEVVHKALYQNRLDDHQKAQQLFSISKKWISKHA